MHHYARGQLMQAEASWHKLPLAAFEALIRIPLALAFATLDALARGEVKLSRSEVVRIIEKM